MRTPARRAPKAAVPRSAMDHFYTLVRDIVQQNKIEPAMIWNFDETGIDRPGKRSPVFQVADDPEEPVSNAADLKEHVTLVSCVNALGHRLPPHFIFKGPPGGRPRENLFAGLPKGHGSSLQLAGACIRCPRGSNRFLLLIRAEKAWMTRATFTTWARVFVNAVKPTPERKALLLIDNHESRHSVKALKYLQDNNVILLAFPPNATLFLQPLDVGVFGALKIRLHEAVDSFAADPRNPPVTRRNIASIAFSAWDECCSEKNVLSGWRKSGIWPLDPRAVPDDRLGPASMAASARAAKPGQDVRILELIPDSQPAAAAAAVPAAESKGATPMSRFTPTASVCRLVVCAGQAQELVCFDPHCDARCVDPAAVP